LLKSVLTSAFLYPPARKFSQAKKIVKFLCRHLTITLQRFTNPRASLRKHKCCHRARVHTVMVKHVTRQHSCISRLNFQSSIRLLRSIHNSSFENRGSDEHSPVAPKPWRRRKPFGKRREVYVPPRRNIDRKAERAGASESNTCIQI
jgi:hypothetical protein